MHRAYLIVYCCFECFTERGGVVQRQLRCSIVGLQFQSHCNTVYLIYAMTP